MCNLSNLPSPGIAIGSPWQVIASGTGAHGSVKVMEIWLDGKKIGQATGNLFDEPLDLPFGSHQLTAVELDTTGHYLKSAPYWVDVLGSGAGPCRPPSSLGVNVCAPTVNTCHTTDYVSISAAGTGASGKVSRMELWVSGVKIANFAGDTINTNLFVSDFGAVTIIEVDSKGAYT
jgi:hypothetical protein